MQRTAIKPRRARHSERSEESPGGSDAVTRTNRDSPVILSAAKNPVMQRTAIKPRRARHSERS
ncbi:MAG: hypothetical protein WEB52_14465, partial [Dehalococcoidia bacterium]